MSISLMVRNSNGQFLSGTTVVNSLGVFVVKTVAMVAISQVASIAAKYLATKAEEKFEAARKNSVNNSDSNVVSL